MRGSLGLVIGGVVGAGAMYLVLRQPWAGGQSPRPHIDAGVAMAPPDAGVKKKKRVKRPSGQPNARPGPDEEFEDTEPPVVLTEADRRMETRGDDVAVPPRKVDMSSDGESRPLNDGEIQGTIGGQSGAVQDCVKNAAMGSGLRATIDLEMVVDGNGRVTKSRIKAPHYLFEKGLQGCAQRALSRLKFPATGAPTRVSFPVNLG